MLVSILGALVIFVTVGIYTCCVASGKSDEWEERWIKERKKEEQMIKR